MLVIKGADVNDPPMLYLVALLADILLYASLIFELGSILILNVTFIKLASVLLILPLNLIANIFPCCKPPSVKTLLAWSSGKDSAWALDMLRGQVEPAALLTTINEAANRVAMHGVRRELLELQAKSAGIRLWPVPLPWPCTNDDYEARMAEACRQAVAEGFDTMAFGDLFLRDVRAYRERQLTGTGLTPLFPLWELPLPPWRGR